MVRSSTNRTNKYSAKIVGDVFKNRIDAQKDAMVAQMNEAVGNQVELESQVKAVASMPAMLAGAYMAYAKQLDKLKRKHGVDALTTVEAQDVMDNWETRGLASGLLILVAAQVGFTVA